MIKTINLSLITFAFINCNEAFAMLLNRVYNQPRTKIMQQQRWCNIITLQERRELIRALQRANHSFKNIRERNNHTIKMLTQQNEIGLQITISNLLSIENLKKNNATHYEIHDIREDVELFDEFERKLTHTGVPL